MIERLIILGFINSKEFLQQVSPVWDNSYLLSSSAQYTARWCLDYFNEYSDAPGRTIEDIYYEKKDAKEIPKDMVDEIKEDLLDLAEEYDDEFNVRYAVYRTQRYIKERHLELHNDAVQMLFEDGDVDAAKTMAEEYVGPVFELLDDLDLGDELALSRMESAFERKATPLITYPGALGRMLNDQLVRGGFVSLMASEKRGKSFWLLDMGFRAVLRGYKVAFFQAGDMTEDQQLMRIGSYLTKLPTNKKYVGKTLLPRADCIRNQLDTCEKEERRCGFGIFTGAPFSEDDYKKALTRDIYEDAVIDFDDYVPCTSCSDHKEFYIGAPWYTAKKITHVVTVEEAQRKLKKFFIDKKRSFRISTHPNNTLTIHKIREILKDWEVKPDGRLGRKDKAFLPDVIIIDYADLLVASYSKEYRHQQNEIWKDLRSLSQERHCLVLTATQADARSYEQELLHMRNFSEDKRKFAHVTAMFGLNQDKHGREKKLGIMRINELVKREGEFDSSATVTVLQNLNLGRPFIDSYL